jgi:hypothetical protein
VISLTCQAGGNLRVSSDTHLCIAVTESLLCPASRADNCTPSAGGSRSVRAPCPRLDAYEACDESELEI